MIRNNWGKVVEITISFCESKNNRHFLRPSSLSYVSMTLRNPLAGTGQGEESHNFSDEKFLVEIKNNSQAELRRYQWNALEHLHFAN